MSRRIMLIPAGFDVGLSSVAIGVIREVRRKGVQARLFKPISQPIRELESMRSKTPKLIQEEPESLPLSYVEGKISEGLHDVVLEEVIELFNRIDSPQQVTIIEGLTPTHQQPYAGRINRDVANALAADIVLVAAPYDDPAESFGEHLEVAAETYGGIKHKRVIGCIINKINAPNKEEYGLLPTLSELEKPLDISAFTSLKVFRHNNFKLLAAIPWQMDLMAPRMIDIANYLDAKIINRGDMEHRRVRSVSFCARSISNMISHMIPNCMVVTPGDRSDIIVTTCLAALNGTKVGGLLLTGGFIPDDKILSLCGQAFESGLPVLSIPQDTLHTSHKIFNFPPQIPDDDEQRQEKVSQSIADYIDPDWTDSILKNVDTTNLLSPPAFRYQLRTLASLANRLIVLPEGNDVRTIKAAVICAERDIARCQLLGDENEIRTIAQQQGIELSDKLIITDPKSIRHKYVEPMVELRKHKRLTDILAVEELKDNVVLGTMMLQQGDVHGLVSGAVNTTANTIRPALQLIKTSPGSSLVSSVFFMLLPDQVLVYGDCAINPDPDAQQLAEIAIQSASSARRLGLNPKVAMISYSTGKSGSGADVEKVARATEIARQREPDLVIDGPLQYDAAIMENVAIKKAPDSPVAGQANVFIFPDLNTGNTTYKAVQRSADLISIGPMLQGLNKPVNDLSRGALVDDIVYTIALTAIQATADD